MHSRAQAQKFHVQAIGPRRADSKFDVFGAFIGQSWGDLGRVRLATVFFCLVSAIDRPFRHVMLNLTR
jgi:hypothetical protein